MNTNDIIHALISITSRENLEVADFADGTALLSDDDLDFVVGGRKRKKAKKKCDRKVVPRF